MITDNLLEVNKTVEKPVNRKKVLIKPSSLVEYSDQFVYGQEKAKKIIATYLASHFNSYRYETIGLKRPALLVTGSTGTGKTFIVQQMAQAINKPVVIISAPQYSPTGYQGNSIENILEEIVEAAYNYKSEDSKKNDISDVIVVLDEIDKLVDANDREFFYRKVQASLLTIVECQEPGFKPCFIFIGSFEEKRKQKKKLAEKTRIGFTDQVKEKIDLTLTVDDIIDAGIIAELAGRIGNVVETDPITDEMLKGLLTIPKGCVKDTFNYMFKSQSIKDSVTDKDIDNLVTLVKKQGLTLGVRTLKNVAEKYFVDRLWF